jgi:hypothetical protein
MSTDAKKRKDKKLDKALDLTFPASDPIAHGKSTSTEPPCRPPDRKAPNITKEQVRQTQNEGRGHQPKRR